jgi:hypothetical protein
LPLIFCTNEEGRAEWLKNIIIYSQSFIQAFIAPDRGARLPRGAISGGLHARHSAGVSFYSNPFIILSVIYITCFYYLLTFRREKVYIMNALMPRFFLMFLRIDPWRIPQQRASHPLFLFLFRDFTQ